MVRKASTGSLTWNGWVIFGLSALAGALLVFLMYLNWEGGPPSVRGGSLMLYCAAGIQPPVAEVVEQYKKECGVDIQVQYGGSGTLLSNLRVARSGDLYLAGDSGYLDIAREEGLVQETIPLARIRPVLAVQKGNPKGLHSIPDLLRDDVRLVLANPDAASIGKQTKALLENAGVWEEVKSHATVFKPTVTEVANDIKLGAVDVGIVWDATVNQYPELEAVRIPSFDAAARQITIGVLKSCRKPAAALHFARYLGASDRGLEAFKRWRYEPVEGDIWENVPEIVLFSGGVNRVAIEETIQDFEEREGVRVSREYGGCGILVAQMKAGKQPDAYFACDLSFVPPVRDLFLDSLEICETEMVLLLPGGNPRGIQELKDLAAPGLKVGVANAEQSALGALTKKLLQEAGLYEEVMANVRTQVPTADLLVNQMRTGSLDVVVVYEANTSRVGDSFEIVRLNHPAARAVQPFSVGKNTKHGQLIARFLKTLRSADSRRRFESVGFHWRAETGVEGE